VVLDVERLVDAEGPAVAIRADLVLVAVDRLDLLDGAASL
jgi:hypothetical protein